MQLLNNLKNVTSILNHSILLLFLSSISDRILSFGKLFELNFFLEKFGICFGIQSSNFGHFSVIHIDLICFN